MVVCASQSAGKNPRDALGYPIISEPAAMINAILSSIDRFASARLVLHFAPIRLPPYMP